MLLSAQGPNPSGSETVARPRNSSSSSGSSSSGSSSSSSSSSSADAPAPVPDQPKIPSKFSKKDGQSPEGVPTFSTEAVTVTVDTAVLDNKGHFIPKIPKENFRVLEDNVPQKLTSVSMGEAPMTIALVIEFSGRFQSYYSGTWRQTLNASYTFLRMLKPEDYLAVVTYDLKPQILSDFSTNREDAQEAMAQLRFPAFRRPICSTR